MSDYHPYRKAHPHSRLLTIEAIVYLVFVIFLFLLSGAATNANPGAVLLGFLPALLFGVLLIVMVETDHFHPTYNWLVLFVLLVIASLIYFIVPSPVASGIDGGTVLVMNGILMMIILFIMQNSYAHERPLAEHEVRKKEPETHVQHHVQHHVHHVEQPKEITDIIHSIEDKIKALNFVIGRVYSVYHGGTERLRSKIRIDKAWYNDFNQIDEKDLEKRRHEAIVLVQKIKDRLAVMEKSEREIFGEEVNNLRNIAHQPSGSDRIIDVLVRNDKDPAQQYYDGAKTFCEEALLSLRADNKEPVHGPHTTHTVEHESEESAYQPRHQQFVPQGTKTGFQGHNPGFKRGRD